MTERPSSDEIMTKWLTRSTLTRDELTSAAMDCLDFVAECLERGHQIGVRFKDGRGFNPITFVIPGITTDSPE